MAEPVTFPLTTEAQAAMAHLTDGITNWAQRRFKLSPYKDFLIERQGDVFIVGYYMEMNGDLVPDPIVWLSDGGARLQEFESNFGTVPLTEAEADYASDFLVRMGKRYLGNAEAVVVNEGP